MSTNRSGSEQQILDVAEKLSFVFPDFDLRFNWLEGGNCLRCILPDVNPDEVLEFELGGATEEIIWEATFAVKQLAQLFDD
ncbi:MAG: hypothetical protein KDD66_12740 [Bdellovibrionales bacterium]|nr:hypothetical protein [Bdellovibrionales bacterium]